MSRHFARALGALAAALALLPRPGLACSVCQAGDPLFSSQGTSAQEAGAFSLYLEARGFRKTSGLFDHPDDAAASEDEEHENGEEHGHGEEGGTEKSNGHRLELFASWTPLDRWTLTLDVPFAWNRITALQGGESSTSTLSGFGDVSLGSSFVLWRNRDVLPSTWFEGRLWLKAPTGRDEAEVDGERDAHLQPGTGSWDFGVGLAAVHRFSFGSFYASAFYRENTHGSLGYTYGDVYLLNAAIEVPIGHAFSAPELEWLTAGLELNFRYSGYDRQNGERNPFSGGAILYATPSVRVRLPWGFGGIPTSLRAAVQLPLTQTWLHNQQREKEVWTVGLLVPF